jgi:hypothetical protein
MRKALRATICARALAAVVIGGFVCAGVAAGATGTSAGKVPRCKTIKVKNQRWGVYVDHGKVSCATAGHVLGGLLAGKGKNVDKGPADSYTLYDGWFCPYDQMGVATCYYGTKPVKNPSRSIFALSCAHGAGEPACPARAKF